MRLPKPKPKPKPTTEIESSSDSELVDEGYESCAQGKLSRWSLSLLEQAGDEEEKRRQDEPELAALLQALCDHLEIREQEVRTQRRQLKRMAGKLEDAQVRAAKSDNRQGQTTRYWHQAKALQRKLLDGDMRMRFPPDD